MLKHQKELTYLYCIIPLPTLFSVEDTYVEFCPPCQDIIETKISKKTSMYSHLAQTLRARLLVFSPS